MKSYGGATWIRLYLQESAPFRATDVIYVLSYPHTPILIACRMKVKMQNILFSVSCPIHVTVTSNRGIGIDVIQ